MSFGEEFEIEERRHERWVESDEVAECFLDERGKRVVFLALKRKALIEMSLETKEDLLL